MLVPRPADAGGTAGLSGPGPREELIRAVARALGYKRTGGSLTAGLGAAVDVLLASGRAVGTGGGIGAAG